MQNPHGFTPLGEATGSVKTAIFGGKHAAGDLARDQFAALKHAYGAGGASRSTLRYGDVAGPIDPSVFCLRTRRSRAPRPIPWTAPIDDNGDYAHVA